MPKGKYEDLTGRRYDRLVVLGRAEDKIASSGRKEVQWLCKCDCGNEKLVTTSCLNNKTVRSCGCLADDYIEIVRQEGLNTFKNTLEERYPGEYTVVGEYINNRTRVMVRHNVCGHTWMVRPDSMTRGNIQCELCMSRKPKTTYRFKREVYDLVGDEYTVLGEYTGANKHILMRHNKCGNEYEVDASSFIRGTRCPKCQRSIGEERIAKILDDRGINYIPQHTFPDCVYKAKLRFDFFLPDLDTCIEFDGRQHFEPIDVFGGVNSFEIRMLKDTIKNDYCLGIGLKMVRIPHNKIDDIEDILVREGIIELYKEEENG